MSIRNTPLGRREVLKGIGALGVGAVVTACGGSNGAGGDATATATRTATSAPATATATSAAPGTATSVPPTTATGARTATPTASAAPSNTAAPTDTAGPTETATSQSSATPSATPSPTVTPGEISCILSPEQTIGPYFIDVGLARSDVREDRDGALLNLSLQVVDADGCTPIRDAVVNIWHADASGVYSGFAGQPGGVDTTGETFLRGFQLTDADGKVAFVTIYPGWYTGRTVHIHVRIHLDATTVLITQLYFPEDVTDAVHAQAPYDIHGQRNTSNATDSIFDADVLLDVAAIGDGYRTSIVLGAAL